VNYYRCELTTVCKDRVVYSTDVVLAKNKEDAKRLSLEAYKGDWEVTNVEFVSEDF